MMQRSIVLFFLFFCLQLVLGNVEKAVFLGPGALQVPIQHPTLEDLQLRALSPEYFTLKTQLQAEFPGNKSINGEASWFLLEGLSEGQRYEVRICWAATQPTSFRVYTFELPEVFGTPELITSLGNYVEKRQAEQQSPEHPTRNVFSTFMTPQPGSGRPQTILLLQVLAAADYYTMNKTLMENVPPVVVDIILDPYIFNILPQSLGPTAVYIIVLAIGSWFIAGSVTKWLQMVARDDDYKKDL